jgi:hypothetical protein
MSVKIIQFERSFASHPKSEFWSDKNIVRPEHVSYCSNLNFYFDCLDCGHELFQKISQIKNKKMIILLIL